MGLIGLPNNWATLSKLRLPPVIAEAKSCVRGICGLNNLGSIFIFLFFFSRCGGITPGILGLFLLPGLRPLFLGLLAISSTEVGAATVFVGSTPPGGFSPNTLFICVKSVDIVEGGGGWETFRL